MALVVVVLRRNDLIEEMEMRKLMHCMSFVIKKKGTNAFSFTCSEVVAGPISDVQSGQFVFPFAFSPPD